VNEELVGTADAAWVKTVAEVMTSGKPVASQSSIGAGGKPSFELRNHQLSFSLRYPIVTVKPNTSWLYMASEAMWVIDGSNKLDYSPEIGRIQEPYSDNRVTLFGAYGPPFKYQLEYILSTLNKDRNSRQAVMAIWRRNPKLSRDIPCSVAMQFLIRDAFIHSNIYMRSSDVGKGLPYDMFTFACMTAEIASRLDVDAELGDCTITAGSRHIYINQYDPLERMLQDNVPLPEDPAYVPWDRWKWPAIKQKLNNVVNMDRQTFAERPDKQERAKQIILEAASGKTNS
jgi:thymidylate synthase